MVNQIGAIVGEKTPEKLKREFSEIFQKRLGTYRGKPIKIEIKENSIPTFLKVRQVPFAMEPKIEQELDMLDESVRICRVYKCTINRVIQNVTPYQQIRRYWQLKQEE